MADWGIKATKAGSSAQETTEPRDFAVHSAYNTLKIAMEGYDTATVEKGVPKEIDVDHNLGYKPVVLFYFAHPEDGKWHQVPARADINQGYAYSMGGGWLHKDTNTITLKLNDGDTMPEPPGEVTVEYKYYIFIDPATDSWYE